MTRAQFRDRCRRPLNLLPGRHQRGAVLERPAIILHVRNLDPARAKRAREIDHVDDPIDVRTMHDRIHRERELASHDFGSECPFLGKRALVTGDAIGGLSAAVLNRNLHMVEPGLSQCAEGLVGDPDRGGDEIGVKAGRMGAGGDVHEIAPRTGLAARQMHLQDAKLRRLVKHPRPCRGVELVLSRVEREGGSSNRGSRADSDGSARRGAQAVYALRSLRRPHTDGSRGPRWLVSQFRCRPSRAQRADIRDSSLARGRVAFRKVIDEFAEGDLAGGITHSCQTACRAATIPLRKAPRA